MPLRWSIGAVDILIDRPEIGRRRSRQAFRWDALAQGLTWGESPSLEGRGWLVEVLAGRERPAACAWESGASGHTTERKYIAEPCVPRAARLGVACPPNHAAAPRVSVLPKTSTLQRSTLAWSAHRTTATPRPRPLPRQVKTQPCPACRPSSPRSRFSSNASAGSSGRSASSTSIVSPRCPRVPRSFRAVRVTPRLSRTQHPPHPPQPRH